MVDLRQTVSDHLGGIEWLASKIPGYKGYKEKEMRREADSLLRRHLANQLANNLTTAEDIASQMLTGPGLAQLDEMGKGNTRLQTLIDKVKTAAQGYAGFFDTIKVKEDQLDILYEFDSTMVQNAEEIGDALDHLQTTVDSGETDKLAPAVRRYVKTVTQVSTEFDKRRDVMIGMM